MKLERPLISFDLEVTGLDTETSRIVEIAAIKLMPDGTTTVKVARLNPTILIPKEASDVHGIVDEDVKDSPTFNRIAKSLWSFFDGCDLTGYNIRRFDVPILAVEFKRASLEKNLYEDFKGFINWPAEDVKIVDAYSIVVMQEHRDLAWALNHYTGKKLEDAHSAVPDARAALDVLLAQSDTYLAEPMAEGGPSTPVPTLDDLDLLQRDPSWVDSEGKFKRVGEDAVITFGKHQGTKLKSLPRDYLSWMLQGNFSEEVKELIRGVY